MTKEERESIINETIERVLLMLPEIIGNLISNHVAILRINKKFYEDYPEFKNSKDVVAAVVESVEGESTLENYDEILRRSVPKIRERISLTRSLDMTSVKKPNRDLSHGEI